MAFISKQCIQVLGQPPCKYALVGMGSLAKDEVSAYSDFEHVLTLNNFPKAQKSQVIERCKEYFRWYSAIFHIIVINLLETDLYSVCIPCLNDHSKPGGNWFYDQFTPQGISFDGMMPHACHFPMGKTEKTKKQPWTTELIQPVDEMVKFLEVKDIKKGYKLGDLLTKTCFVEGDEAVYQQFLKTAKTKLEKSKKEQDANVIAQLKEDLENFYLPYNLDMFLYNKIINIKRVIYRTITLFISALGRLRGVDKNSSFKIIAEFERKKMISDFAAHKFSYAVAIACHVRMFYYTSKKRQSDDIYKEFEDKGREKLKEMTTVVSLSSVVECIVTALGLQQILMFDQKIEDFEVQFKEQRIFLHLSILSGFGLFEKVIEVGEKFMVQVPVAESIGDKMRLTLVMHHLSEAYIMTQQLDKCLQIHDAYKSQSTFFEIDDNHSFQKSFRIAELLSLFYLNSNNDHLILKETNNLLKTYLLDPSKYQAMFLNGKCKIRLEMFHEALSVFRDCKRHFTGNALWDNTMRQAHIRILVFECLMELGRENQSLHHARETLNFLSIIECNAHLYDKLCQVIRSLEVVPSETYSRCDWPTPLLPNL